MYIILNICLAGLNFGLAHANYIAGNVFSSYFCTGVAGAIAGLTIAMIMSDF